VKIDRLRVIYEAVFQPYDLHTLMENILRSLPRPDFVGTVECRGLHKVQVSSYTEQLLPFQGKHDNRILRSTIALDPKLATNETLLHS
jgi:hypothetical protein